MTKLMSKHEIILDFIKQFRDLGAYETFSHGMCYYFTVILRNRFLYSDIQIMYDPVTNHWATQIDDHLYDISGDITTDSKHYVSWTTYALKEPTHTTRLARQCIDKIPDGVITCRYCYWSDYDDYHNLMCHKPGQIAPVQADYTCCQAQMP